MAIQKSKSTELKVFAPNNHSKYEIRWRDVEESVKKECFEIYAKCILAKEVITVHQVDELEKMSNNYRVVWLDGDNNPHTDLLRRHIRWGNADDIDTIDRIALRLSQNDIPVPIARQLPLSPGYRRFAEYNGHFWQIYPFITGEHYRGMMYELRDIAKNIARMHYVLAKAPFVEDVKRKTEPRSPWTRDEWVDMLKRAEKREEWADILLDDNKRVVIDAMDAVEPHKSAMEQSPKQIIHRDLHPWNTIFEVGKLKAILDFNDAHYGELFRDIAYACHRFVRQVLVSQKVEAHEEDEFVVRAMINYGVRNFMESYDSEDPASSTLGHGAIIGAFMQDELLTKTLNNFKSYYEGDRDELIQEELHKKLTLMKEASILGDVITKL